MDHDKGYEAVEPPSNNSKLTHERKPGLSFEDLALIVLGILSGVMLGISFTILSEETGPLANLKVLVLTISASLAAYSVNRIALKRGAPLAAIGFPLAGVLSVTAILTVGFGMYIGSLSGLIHKEADGRGLERHGIAQTEYVAATNKAALDAETAGPVLQVIADDLSGLAACERLNSCVSGKGYGGRGRVTRTLEGVAGKAETIAAAFAKGANERRKLLGDLNDLSGRYIETLEDSTVPLRERRTALQRIHGEIGQVAAMLAETLPVSLLKSFARELQDGVAIAGDPAASKRVSEILAAHGDSLEGSLASAKGADIEMPIFAPRPGMIDVLGFLGDFAALAAVVFVAEVCLPITLFTLTYLKLVWEIERRTQRSGLARDDGEEDGFGDLLDLPPLPPARANGHDKRGGPKTGKSRRTRGQ